MSKMTEEGSLVLEPATVFRPVIDHDGVKLLAERLYGISVLELIELNGYDDKNYKIIEDPNVKNPLITNHSPHGYVLKIMNSMDSTNLDFVEAQNEIMNFLNTRSVTCPKPIRNVFGHLYSVENIGGKNHVIRLLEYVPGEILKDVPRSESLFYQLGEFVANLDNKLQLGETQDKRKVPTMLQKLLRYDSQVTKKFVDMSQNITALRSLRIHSKFLEVSCHGIVWLAGWLSFIWLFNNKELYQLQVNVLIALLLDIVVIAVLKAFVRRRRPVPMNKLLPGNPDKYSFPSGHSSRAAMIAFILICIDPISFIFYPPLLAWVGAVALSRVLAERHYFLDVLGGLGIGVLEGLLMSLIWFSQSTAISIISTLSDEKKDGGEYHV